MDTKNIIIIVESVLLVVLLIVILAVVVRGGGGGQAWPFSSKRTDGAQESTIMARSRRVQALNDAEDISNGKQPQSQRAKMMNHGLSAGYYRIGPDGIPVHQYDDLLWDPKQGIFVSRYGHKVSDSAYSDW